jgi:hypothetical protein
MSIRYSLIAVALVAMCALSRAGADGPVGHTILAQKTINEIRAGSLAASPELTQALADPECQRAFRGGAVAPDISEDVSHYGKTGELAQNLVETAKYYLERAEKSGSPAEIKRAQKQLAFAYGWLSHCAADLETHPKVNGFSGDAWVHNDKGQKTIHAAREAQLTAYLTKLYPQAAGQFDVSIPYDFMSGVTGIDEAKLRQAMVVLKGKAAAEQWAKGKVTLTIEQLEAIWGPCVRATLEDSRTFVNDPRKMRNWDLDCGGRLSTEEFEALRKLVLALNGGTLPPGWGTSYITWFDKTRGLSLEQRGAKLKELIKGATSASVKPDKLPKGQTLQTYRAYYPSKQLKTEYTYYLDANGRQLQHGVCRMWHANGKLSDEVPMVHGKMQGVWQAYYATGERMFEQTYADGKLNGPATRFYQSGKKEEYGIHENGQKDGVWITWHENGQKKGEDEYENGARIRGKSRRWDEQGRELQLVGDW